MDRLPDNFNYASRSVRLQDRRRAPRRAFGIVLIALVGLATLVLMIKVATGDSSPAAVVVPEAVGGAPGGGSAIAPGSSPSTALPSSAASPAAIAPQLQKIIDVGKPVYCGGGTQNMVALTFDDGPGPYTDYTLETLRTYGAKATFFVVAKLFSTLDNQRQVAREAIFGDVGNHSWNHFGLAGEPASTLKAEVLRPKQAIEDHTGDQVVFFRPPWGSRDAALDSYVQSLGMIEVMWSFDTFDSAGAKTEEIIGTIANNAEPGSIILLHENRGTTRNALPGILTTLQQLGLRPVTLTTLLTEDPPTTKQLKHGPSAC